MGELVAALPFLIRFRLAGSSVPLFSFAAAGEALVFVLVLPAALVVAGPQAWPQGEPVLLRAWKRERVWLLV